MSEDGISPIRTRFLQRNHLFAIEFAEGWVFGRVLRRRISRFRPYYLIDQSGNALTIQKQSTQAALYFRDPRNAKNDLLFLNKSTDSGWPWWMHGAMGLAPNGIYQYVHLPDSGPIDGQFPNADITSAQSGDFTGFVSGSDSPYEEPTDYRELIISPGIKISAEYYNEDTDRAYRPALNLVFATYWSEIFTPDTSHTRGTWESAMIGKIARREGHAANARFFTAGLSTGDTFRPYPLGASVMKDWSAVPITLDEAELQ